MDENDEKKVDRISSGVAGMAWHGQAKDRRRLQVGSTWILGYSASSAVCAATVLGR